jgi:hypothetical protein
MEKPLESTKMTKIKASWIKQGQNSQKCLIMSGKISKNIGDTRYRQPLKTMKNTITSRKWRKYYSKKNWIS